MLPAVCRVSLRARQSTSPVDLRRRDASVLQVRLAKSGFRARRGDCARNNIRVLSHLDAPSRLPFLDNQKQYALPRSSRGPVRSRCSGQGPNVVNGRKPRSQFHNRRDIAFQSAIPKHGFMGGAVRRFDFGSVLPPNTYDIDEIGIRNEQRCELVHVMPVPSVRKSSSDVLGLAVRHAHGATPSSYFPPSIQEFGPDRDKRGVGFQTARYRQFRPVDGRGRRA